MKPFASTSPAGWATPVRVGAAFDLGARAWSRLSPAERFGLLGVLACASAGVWLRTRGMFVGAFPLWGDEATWALRLAHGIDDHGMRPPGFMSATDAMVRLFSWREWPLRFLPWLSGVLGALLAIPIAHNLFRSQAARLVFVAAIAFNPAAIDLAKEFKPYSVSLLMHELGLLLALRYWNDRRERWLWLTAAWALAALLFAQDVIFAYPGVFGALGLAAFRGPWRHRAPIALGAAASAALVLAFYLLAWRHMDAGQGGEAASYWGHRYDVFFRGEGSKLAWLVHKQVELAGLPGVRRVIWGSEHPFLAQVDLWVWGLLHVAGLVTLGVQRRFRDAILLALPLATLVVFNLLSYWPAGAFRTNLFTLLYTAAIAGAALDWPLLASPLRSAGAALGLVLAPLFAFEHDFHARKDAFAGSSAMPDVMRRLAALKGFGEVGDDRESLFLDGKACECFEYYASLHPDYSQLAQNVTSQFRWACSRNSHRTLPGARKHIQNGGDHAWIVFATGSAASLGRALAKNHLRITREDSFGDDNLLIRVENRDKR